MLKPKCVRVAVSLLALVSVTPALAAPRKLKTFVLSMRSRPRFGTGEARGKHPWLTA